jgi:small subunit ribosomal protein S2
MPDVTMRRMLEAGVHFGHQTRFWNPKMSPYIFGERNKIHIINLEKTLPLFNEAAVFIRRIVADGGKVLFVGSKRAARQAMTEEAVRCGMPYVSQRWLGGMLTNFKTIRQSVKRLRELEEITQDGSNRDFTKKELLRLSGERDKLERALGGIKEMDSLPDVVFIVDVGHEEIAVKEARKLNIPVVAVVDTNCSPKGIDFAVPGNDDAMRAIRLYAEAIADTIIEGKASIPEMPMGDDEFVELDEDGRPKVESAKPRAKKANVKKRAKVARSVATADESDTGAGAAEASVAVEPDGSVDPAADPAEASNSSAETDEAVVANPESMAAEPAAAEEGDTAAADAGTDADADADADAKTKSKPKAKAKTKAKPQAKTEDT